MTMKLPYMTPIPKSLNIFFNVKRFLDVNEVKAFKPDMFINCVSLQATEKVFDQVIPLLPKGCILSDIASVKKRAGRIL